MTARAVFVMHKAAAHNFSSSKYKALRRMRLCSGSASSNSNRAALSVYAWAVPVWTASGANGSGFGARNTAVFSLQRALHGFVFYAADRELSKELKELKELTVEFPEELLKELPEMYQVGLILATFAASMVNIAILAASMAC